MFKSQKTDASNLTIIAKGDSIEGTLRVAGRVHVDGDVDGTIIAEGAISIGPDGKIRGEVNGSDVAVAGRIEGVVRANGSLHMLPTGVVEGDAYFDALEVERGGVIYGQTGKIGEAPTEGPKLKLAKGVEREETKSFGAAE